MLWIHIITFLFIISILVGMVSLTILVGFRSDIEKSFSIDYLSMRRFILTFFCFSIVNFLIYYNEYFMLYGAVKNILLTTFDILLILTVFFCIQMNSLPSKGVNRLFCITGLAYIIVWCLVYFNNFVMSSYLAAVMELLVDAVFCSVTGGIMVMSVFYQKKNNADLWERQYLVTTDIMTGIYVALLYCADLVANLSAAYSPNDYHYPYLYDPLPLIYMAVNIYTMVYLINKLKIVRQEPSPAADAGARSGGNVNMFNLSAREQEVAELVVQGLSNPEIAEALSISIYTVKRHMNSIFKKANAKNRFELLCTLRGERREGGREDE